MKRLKILINLLADLLRLLRALIRSSFAKFSSEIAGKRVTEKPLAKTFLILIEMKLNFN